MNLSSQSEPRPAREPLAIVGIGCRLPGGVVDAQSYWEMLVGRRSGIVEVPANRWNKDRYYHKERAIPGRMITKWGGFVDNLDEFDPAFWGVSPREAMRMDPQQRWLLEVTWEAIEDAGIPPAALRGKSVGVYVGIASNDYAGLQMPNWDETDVHTNSGCTLSIASNRIAYMFDFKGPAVSVDTACSSALVAMSQACNAIWSGECDAAVTGGVNALITPHATIGFSKASMLSPSGQCFAFDDRANGYVRGEGAAMVLIKPYSQAVADGDPVYAVIRAAVVNQDGHTSSMTVPSVEGQSEMLRMAYRDAGIKPGRVVYMEAHGTGTQVGDPIETMALGNVLSQGRPEGESCLIGSCKTNVGHLESGSGAAGLLKAALVLHHDMVPPNLNFKNPNPNIPFERLRLKVATELQPLPHQPGHLPVAAVNSFGFGGTNAHIVLEAPPEREYGGRLMSALAKPNGRNGHNGKNGKNGRTEHDNGVLPTNAHLRGVGKAARPCLLPISARDEHSLQGAVSGYVDFLDEPSHALADVCYSAGQRKDHHPHRLVVAGHDAAEMQARMREWLDAEDKSAVDGIIEGRTTGDTGGLTFVFTGQGAQWWKMGRDLFHRESIFRRMLWRIDSLLQPLAGWSLVDAMMKTEGEEDSQIHRTSIAQPAIFALQVALAELWKSWGVEPAKVIGHSVGEVAAAYVAGAYTLEDAVKIIVHRSRLQDSAGGDGAGGDGRMVAVGISAAEARRAIGDHAEHVQVAVVNSPSLVTLAGDREPLEEIVAKLEAEGNFVRWLRINYAFHTHHMDPIKDELLEALADIQPRATKIPYISTVTASVLAGEKLDAKYWWRNVRQPVLFAPALTNLVVAGERFFLELGPHPALESSITEILASQNKQGDVFHSLKRKTDETTQILSNLAGLHAAGGTIDWASVNQSSGQFVRLPRYAWHHERYWLESPEMARERLDPFVHPMLGERLLAAKPTWQFKLDPRLFDYLVDHQIWDSIICPAAGYVEIGLALARELFPDEPYCIEEMQTKKGLFVSEDKVPTVQVVFDDTDNTYRIFSSTDGEDWELNAQGRLVKYTQSASPKQADVVDLQKSLTEHIDHERYYYDFHEAGYGFGPDFSQIQQVWRVAGEALGLVEVPEHVLETVDEYHYHPAVLDACFQASMAVQIVGDDENAADFLYLPESIRRIYAYQDKLPEKFYAHARLLVDDGDSLTTDILVYDESGDRIADILGFRVERMEQSRSGADDLDNCFYQFQWELTGDEQEEQQGETSEVSAATDADTVGQTLLIFADSTGVADQLAADLQARGDVPILVRPGQEFATSSDSSFTINPASESDLKKLFSAETPGEQSPTAIVHLWSLDHAEAASLSADDLDTAQQTGVLSTLHLQRVAAEHEWEQAPRIYVVARDVQHVLDTDGSSGITAAPIVGFARVAYNEHPQFRWTLLDLEKTPSKDDAAQLLSEIVGNEEELEVAWRDGERYVNRLKRVRADELPAVQRPGFDADGELIPYRLQTNKPGVLTNLSLNETPCPEPGPDEIQVRVKAGGINFRDVMKALGMYPGNPIDLLWFGDDFSGVIEKVGENVTKFKVGDEVAGMAPYCFRAFCNVDHRMVFRKPAHLSFEEAATLPTVFLTAHYCLNELGRMQPGEKVLIHAGTGGVGQAAIQIAKRLGLEIFSTAGTPEKRQMLTDMGVHHVMNSRTLEFADEVMQITDRGGVDAVLNSLAGEFIPKSFSVLAPFGRFLEIGKIDVYGNSKIGLEPLKDNISYFVIDLAQHLQEKPAYVAKMFDELSERFAAGDYEPLTHTVFPITDVVEAFRYMAQGKHVGKNVLSFDVGDDLQIGPCTEPEHLFRPDATYLITGGAGGFGLELAQWMVEHGARHLALVSRSGPKGEAAEVIAGMLANGVEIYDARGDVTSPDGVQNIVDHIQANMPPLKGVVHGAVVLDDEFIAELDEQRFNRVLNPKMIGAWNLHLATRELPLEHFISFSSFSNIIGGTKQSNYNAGNSFLDSLAHHRRACGLPALTFNWGALGGAGILTRDEKTAEYLDKLGMKAFTVPETLKVVGRMMLLDPGQLGASRMAWPSVARLSPLVARSSTYAELAHESKDSGGGNIAARILATAPEQRLPIIEDFLVEQVAGVFGEDADKIDRETPLTALGLDSLMSIDLMNRVETELGLSIPMGNVLRGPNLKELAAILLDLLGDAGGAAAGEEGETAAEGSGLAPLERVEDSTGEFPLTEGQQALWFLYRLAPNSSAYNLTFSAKFTPHVDIDDMQRAFAALFEQHPMLDVTFSDVSGVPMQRLRRGGTIDFREHDATGLSEEEMNALLVEHANKPFDLENGPVIRCELFRTEDSHIGLMCMHHIISDAWSVTVLIKDLIESYFTLRAGRQPQFDPQPFTYEDFVAWEGSHLGSDSGTRMRDHWLTHLQDAPQTINLQTDHPRPPVQTFRGGTTGFKLDDDLTQDVLTLAAEQNVTLFTLLLSAYEVLLHQYTRQQDFLVGVPLAGRGQRELHSMVGYFVNPVPLRSQVEDDPTFIDFLVRNSDNVAGALDNQQYPLKRLVNDLDIARDTSRSPLFQVAFSMERIPGFDEQGIAMFLIGQGGHRFHLGDFTMETVDLTLRQAQFEILLVVEEAGGSIYGCWQYNRDLFDADTIDRLNELYEDVLRQLVRKPTQRISDFTLEGEVVGSTSEDWADKIHGWNETDCELNSPLPVHQQVEAQAARTPDDVAVVCGGLRLTYGAMNEQANRLAHHLRSLGVGPDTRVGICMQRSTDLIVAIQAVLKAGGAYVPLDPKYPQSRLESIAQSAGMDVVVTHQKHAIRLGDGCGKLVCVDAESHAISQNSSENPEPLAGPDNLMYVIYTSGTTGEPKGAAVYHRGFTNLLDWFLRDFEITDDDRSLVITSHGFDLTQKNLYAALMVGGQVHLTAHQEYDPSMILQEIAASEITLLNCTPSTFYPLVDEPTDARLAQLDSVRTVFLGGEPIDMSKLASWRSRKGFAAELVNTYGPTECTDICSFYRVPAGSNETEIPVGHPIYNVKTYVLDTNLRPVAPGQIGELCISGAGVGAGYINDASLTDEKFVANPFTDDGSLMYRTGDMCRQRDDGAIVFAGRADDQVKIRGFRIELGEIESHLCQHPAVSDAVVIAREDQPHVKRLVAYPVFADGETPTNAGLKEFLAERLPDHMVPGYYVPLDELPLTPHGKVDRRSLPAPDASGDRAGDARYVGARDGLEAELVAIYQEVLGTEMIGVLDGFFALGGDSLSSVQVISMIRRQLGIEMPLAVLLQGDSVAQVATFLRQHRERQWSSLVPIQPHGDRPPLFLVHPVGGNVLCYSDLIESLPADQPVYGIQARGVDGGSEPTSSMDEMVAEYLEVIQKTQPSGPYHLAAWSSGGVVAYELARQLKARGEEVAMVAMFDSLSPDQLDFDADDEVTTLLEMVAFLNRFYDLGIEATADELAPLTTDERLRLIMDRAKERNPFLPVDIDEEYARRFLAVCRANLKAIDSYRPQAASVPVVLYRAADPAGRSADAAGVADAGLGWGGLLNGSLDIEEVPGNHVTMLTGENARGLATLVAERIGSEVGTRGIT